MLTYPIGITDINSRIVVNSGKFDYLTNYQCYEYLIKIFKISPIIIQYYEYINYKFYLKTLKLPDKWYAVLALDLGPDTVNLINYLDPDFAGYIDSDFYAFVFKFIGYISSTRSDVLLTLLDNIPSVDEFITLDLVTTLVFCIKTDVLNTLYEKSKKKYIMQSLMIGVSSNIATQQKNGQLINYIYSFEWVPKHQREAHIQTYNRIFRTSSHNWGAMK